MITGLHHVSLSVGDLHRSIRFYERLGFIQESVRYNITTNYFRKVIDYENAIVHNALLQSSATPVRLELMQYVIPAGEQLDLATPNIGSTHMCFVVEDLPLICKQLKEHEVRFKTEPIAIDSGPNQGGYAVYMLDPDGYTMELLQRPKEPK